MLVSILIAGVVVSTIVTLVINLVKGQSIWNAFGVFFFSLLVGLFVLLIVGAGNGKGKPEYSTQISERTFQVAEKSGINNSRTATFIYVDNEQNLQEFDEYVAKIHMAEGTGKTVRVVETRHQVGTAIFPWGESWDEKVMYIK